MIVEIDEHELWQLKDQLSQYKKKCADLEKQLDQTQDENNHLQFRIDTELEPRIKAEHDSYDCWVTIDRGAEACECFEYKLDDLIGFVDENLEMFDWEDRFGDLSQKILYLIKHRDEDELNHIEGKY